MASGVDAVFNWTGFNSDRVAQQPGTSLGSPLPLHIVHHSTSFCNLETPTLGYSNHLIAPQIKLGQSRRLAQFHAASESG